MNHKACNAFASHGLEILKLSVVRVLHQARDESIPCLAPTAIGDRLGIAPTRWETQADHALILNILNRLEAEKRVVKFWIGSAYKWKIAEADRQVIEG